MEGVPLLTLARAAVLAAVRGSADGLGGWERRGWHLLTVRPVMCRGVCGRKVVTRAAIMVQGGTVSGRLLYLSPACLTLSLIARSWQLAQGSSGVG